MTSHEMMRAGQTPAGYWWENVAPLGCAPDWQMRVAPTADAGLIFGYRPSDLLAKQYRSKDRVQNRAA